MIAKIKITAVLKVLTGLHIGDNSGYAPIGALGIPVIRDSYSGDPFIPGSSLKGKMRSLLVKSVLTRGAVYHAQMRKRPGEDLPPFWHARQ